MRHVPTGRIRRLARVVALAPQVGTAMVGGEAARRLVADRLLRTLGELKGGSMKLGQVLAQVAETLPDDVRARLGGLFHGAATLPWEAMSAVLDAELPDRALLAEIDPEPFAGASLGQVHRGVLADGRRVAVKIQYPDVGVALTQDLANLRQIATVGTGGGLVLDIGPQLTAVCDGLLAELDYTRERDALVQVAALVAPWPELVVPAPIDGLCTGRVLTTELLDGPTLHQLGRAPDDRGVALSRALTTAILGPALHGGVLNADAHPGNFVALPDGRLGLLDFGALTALSDDTVDGIRALVGALLDGERDLVPALTRLGFELDPGNRRVVRTAGAIRDALRPLVAGPHDFSRDTTMRALTEHKARHPLDSLPFVPTADVAQLMRALTGLLHGLCTLGATADLAPTLRALIDPPAR